MSEDTPYKYMWNPCLMRFLWELQIIPISNNQFRAIAAVPIWLVSAGKSLATLKLHGVLVLTDLLLKQKQVRLWSNYRKLQVQLLLYLPSMFNLKHYISQQGSKMVGFLFFFFSKIFCSILLVFPFHINALAFWSQGHPQVFDSQLEVCPLLRGG